MKCIMCGERDSLPTTPSGLYCDHPECRKMRVKLFEGTPAHEIPHFEKRYASDREYDQAWEEQQAKRKRG